MQTKNVVRVIFAIAILWGLIACGGGGSNSAQGGTWDQMLWGQDNWG